MAKSKDKLEDNLEPKGNSADTLLPIHILRILKKHSSSINQLSAQQILDLLLKEKNIDENENLESQKKKIRRHLDTLHKSYGDGCIRKTEGKSRKEGNYWYYDASRDPFANEEQPIYETLSNEEIEFIIDIIASSKIINTQSTHDIIKKLLKKANLSKEEKKKKWKEIKKEVWPKSTNEEFVWLRDDIQSCMDEYRRIRFDYGDKKSILATPYGWDSDANGRYVMIAKVDGDCKFTSFLLEKIQNLQDEDIDPNPDEDAYWNRNDKAPNDEISLESLFVNIQKIKSAIKEMCTIEFEYLSYVIRDKRVFYGEKSKRVLPHSLVFTDGKYHLIGFDEMTEMIDFYRVDFISQLTYSKTEIEISDRHLEILKNLERAREIEKHPLMSAGNEQLITFKVIESELDRVLDTFGKKVEDLIVTTESRPTALENTNLYIFEERLVTVQVKTTAEEAFRWALANADAVELSSTQDIRNRLGRIAKPIYQLYTHTLPDKVRENLDYIYQKGTFRITDYITKDIAYATFNELVRRKNTGAVNAIFIGTDIGEQEAYLNNFINARSLRLNFVPECEDISWASKLINIESLEICKTQIEDVSCLKEMKKLKHLRIENSPVSDLSMLSEHINICDIHLINTNVYDISFIENYQHLTWLYLVGSPIKTHSSLLKLPCRLKSLDIDEHIACKIDIDQIKQHYIGINIAIHNKKTFWYT